MEQAQVGDIIEIINSRHADWVKKGNSYTVLEVGDPDIGYTNKYLRLNTERNNDYYWACSTHDYKITYRCSGEASVLDTEAIDKQLHKLAKDEILAIAKQNYPPGTNFKSISSDSIYTVSHNPDYQWSHDTQSVYAWMNNDFRAYICKGGDWAEIINTSLKSNIDTFDFEEAKKRYRESLKYESWDEFMYTFNKTNKNQQNGTETNKSVKLQGTNLQIREGNPIRGIGLKSSRSKIKLGSNYSYN